MASSARSAPDESACRDGCLFKEIDLRAVSAEAAGSAVEEMARAAPLPMSRAAAEHATVRM
jgi:hypothetical protein